MQNFKSFTLTSNQDFELTNIVLTDLVFETNTTNDPTLAGLKPIEVKLIKDNKTEILIDDQKPLLFYSFVDNIIKHGFHLGHIKLSGSDRLLIKSENAYNVTAIENKIENDYYIKYNQAVPGVKYENVLYIANKTDNLQLIVDDVSIITNKMNNIKITNAEDYMIKLPKLVTLQLIEIGNVNIAQVKSFSKEYKQKDNLTKIKLANIENQKMMKIIKGDVD